MELHYVGCRVTPDTKAHLQDIATRDGVSVDRIIRTAIENYCTVRASKEDRTRPNEVLFTEIKQVIERWLPEGDRLAA